MSNTTKAKGQILSGLIDSIGPQRTIKTLEDPINFQLFESLAKIHCLNWGSK